MEPLVDTAPDDLPPAWRERLAADRPHPRDAVLLPPPRDDMRSNGLALVATILIGVLVLRGAGGRLLSGEQGDGAMVDAALVAAMLAIVGVTAYRFARAVRRGRPSPDYRQGLLIADDGLVLLWGARATLLPRAAIAEVRDRPLRLGALTLDRDAEVRVRDEAGERWLRLPIRTRESAALAAWLADPSSSFHDHHEAPA